MRAAQTLLLLVTFAALVLAGGCSNHGTSTTKPVSIDAKKVEKLAVKAAKRDSGYTPSVACPRHIDASKGSVTFCTATFQLSRRSTLTERVLVEATGRRDQVFVRLIAKAQGAYFERLIATLALRKHINIQKVTCPAEVERIKGAVFSCSAIVAGAPYVLKVQHTNWQGRIRILTSSKATGGIRR